MDITRRRFLARTACGVAGAVAAPSWVHAAEAEAPRLRLSACDWSLKARGPEGLEIAQRVGLDGLEISAGSATDTLDVAKPEVRRAYKEYAAKTGVIVSSVAMGFLNGAPLAEDPRGPAWLEQTIDAAKDLSARVILLAFFGKGDLRHKDELKTDCINVVVERIKEAAPRAEKAGVVLGLENTLSGKDNLAILERIGSDAVQVYYDTGNSSYNGYDVPAKITPDGLFFCAGLLYLDDEHHFLRMHALRVIMSAAGRKCEFVPKHEWKAALADEWYCWWLINKKMLEEKYK